MNKNETSDLENKKVYAYYKDIQNYFLCSKAIAKSLWQKGIIPAHKKEKYMGYEYPIFL